VAVGVVQGESLVLCYHAIGEAWSSSVSAERLRHHVEFLLRRGYEPRRFIDVVTSQDGTRSFAITFDDAYTSVLERAFPVLEALAVPGTVFVVTDFADAGRPVEWAGLVEAGVAEDPTVRRSLTWEQLGDLQRAGWEIGSHTCSHPHLPQLDDVALAWELGESRAACERALGVPCRSIAYPYGDLDDRVVAATEVAGYDAGCSLSVFTSGALAWPRVGVYGADRNTRFRAKVSPAVLTVRRALARRTPIAR
jgi:peptidoglycan/xylan/chitin deacetylase (PgdA/CDA1 family)